MASSEVAATSGRYRMTKLVNPRVLPGGLGAVLIATAVACKSPTPVPQPKPANTGKDAKTVALAQTPQPDSKTSKIAPVGAERTRSDPGLCPALCNHTVKHACGMALPECVSGCEGMLSLPVCQHEVKVAYGCMAGQPTENFECHEGAAVIKDGYCDAEQGAFAGCLERLAKSRK